MTRTRRRPPLCKSPRPLRYRSRSTKMRWMLRRIRGSSKWRKWRTNEIGLRERKSRKLKLDVSNRWSMSRERPIEGTLPLVGSSLKPSRLLNHHLLWTEMPHLNRGIFSKQQVLWWAPILRRVRSRLMTRERLFPCSSSSGRLRTRNYLNKYWWKISLTSMPLQKNSQRSSTRTLTSQLAKKKSGTTLMQNPFSSVGLTLRSVSIG